MTDLKSALCHKLTSQELSFLRASYDIIGSIALIEIPRELIKKQRIIAQTLLTLHKNVHTVAKKGKHTGRYRRQKITFITGEKKTETTHIESGVRMTVDVEQCYFTPRLAHERERIAHLIKKKEQVLVLFGGVAPYALVIAKNSPVAHVTSVELNPIAHYYALKNIQQNKFLQRITAIHADVKKFLYTNKKRYDRVILAYPKGSQPYISLALPALKKGGVMHLYDFQQENTFTHTTQKLLSVCKHYKNKCKILRIVKAGQHAPRVYRICVDAKIT